LNESGNLKISKAKKNDLSLQKAVIYIHDLKDVQTGSSLINDALTEKDIDEALLELAAAEIDYTNSFSSALKKSQRAAQSVTEISNKYELFGNYPNPFNPSTTIKFSIPSVGNGHVHSSNTVLKVFDILGREVAVLVNAPMSAGEHEVTFKGSGLPSGVYIYTLKVNEFSQSRKMLLLK